MPPRGHMKMFTSEHLKVECCIKSRLEAHVQLAKLKCQTELGLPFRSTVIEPAPQACGNTERTCIILIVDDVLPSSRAAFSILIKATAVQTTRPHGEPFEMAHTSHEPRFVLRTH